MPLTRHCHSCGWEYTLTGQPGRTEACHQCGADLKVCLNCTHYDLRVADQCRERRADPVQEKNMANFCEWFEYVKREWGGKKADARMDAARENLRKLFGD
jgi:ribosome-binding protein aMBF1 (putative translation factor)